MSFEKFRLALNVTAGATGERLSVAERLVYLLLANYHSDEKGYAFPSVRTLSRQACMSVRHCRYALTGLTEKGLLVREGAFEAGGQIANRYLVIIPETPLQDSAAPLQDSAGGGVPTSGEGKPGAAPRAADGRDPLQPAAAKYVSESRSESSTESEDEYARAREREHSKALNSLKAFWTTEVGQPATPPVARGIERALKIIGERPVRETIQATAARRRNDPWAHCQASLETKIADPYALHNLAVNPARREQAS